MRSRRLLCVLGSFLAAANRIDTSSWIGAEYTPAGASNSLWWSFFDLYDVAIQRELSFASKRLGLNTVRMFLHTMTFKANSTELLASMDKFLVICDGLNITAGFVFFDDCWSHSGASVVEQCVPSPGVHNGCWMASPQDAERSNVLDFQAYVETVVTHFVNDTRVRWWEIYNEPEQSNSFSMALRDAGYAWATALSPLAPVISCWDDNVDTQIVDVHRYSADFSSDWFPGVYSNISKGAVITEGGSRWYQPPFSSDQGSPLTSINFLTALAAMKETGKVPFTPGAMLSWEVFVGNSNTRWHWNSAPGTPEPLVPWDAWLFPDGTPISYTEAAALRRYASGVDPFISFSKFLPIPASVVDGDMYLTLQAGEVWNAPMNGSQAPPNGLVSDALIEVSVWLAAPASSVSLVFRAAPPSSSVKAPASNCTSGAFMNNTDVCPGGPSGYRDMDLSHTANALGVCAAACCAWEECSAWIVRKFSGSDGNCSGSNVTCCWLKPGCSETVPAGGAISAFVARPPGPSAPTIDGYAVTLDAVSSSLTVSRTTAGSPVVLDSFNVSSLDNGLILGAWNVVRVLITTSLEGSAVINVWLNPMFGETGFVGNPNTDSARTPWSLPPRISVVDVTSPTLPAGGVAISAGGAAVFVDYASVLQPDEL